jgi:hypothetical protein
MMDRLTIDEIEGLTYTVLHYMGPDAVENPTLAEWWRKAREAFAEIERILYP